MFAILGTYEEVVCTKKVLDKANTLDIIVDNHDSATKVLSTSSTDDILEKEDDGIQALEIIIFDGRQLIEDTNNLIEGTKQAIEKTQSLLDNSTLAECGVKVNNDFESSHIVDVVIEDRVAPLDNYSRPS